MQARLLTHVALVALALTACTPSHRAAPTATAPILSGDPAHPGVTRGWLDTKLYFGLGTIDQPDKGISKPAGVNSSTRK